jgi:hypothetical protein
MVAPSHGQTSFDPRLPQQDLQPGDMPFMQFPAGISHEDLNQLLVQRSAGLEGIEPDLLQGMSAMPIAGTGIGDWSADWFEELWRS